jgi:plastocyanin
MNPTLLLHRHLRWLNLPGAMLFALLQRTPAVRVAATAAEYIAASPIGVVLRNAAVAAASLGAIHSMAGATTLVTNSHNSPLSATVGTAVPTVVFGVQGAQGLPGSWKIGGSIPAGLSFSGRTTTGTVNTSSLTLTGTPTTAGSYSVTLQAWENANASGNGSPIYAYVINVAAAAATAPAFTTQPASQTVNVGTTVTFTAAASGSPAPIYQWTHNNTAISGATGATLTLPNVQAADAGSYAVSATNSAGTALSNAATLTVNAVVTTPAPAFTAQPASQTVSIGSTVVFNVGASDAAAFQWKFNNAAIPGATSAMLVLTNLSAANAGSYTCTATGAGGTATSNSATLTVGSFAAASVGHLVNVSILTIAGAGAKVLTVGATIGGSGTTGALPLVVRAVGPTLASAFGLGGTLADPVLTVTSSATGSTIATNDNWGGGTIMANAFSAVGAFALPAASLDSAFVTLNGLAAGGYTVQVTSKDGSSGTVLAEIYDAGDATRTATTPRMINLSTLTAIDASSSLSAGFVLRGSTSRTLLIRGVGPSLAALGVGGTMNDPKLEFYSNDTGAKLAENDNWGGDAPLAMASVGAFALAGPTTKDAVLLLTLPPGAYSARVSDTAGAAGTAIVEIYEVP